MRKTIFHEDWWLDIVAPGSWSEVRAEHGYLRFATSNRLLFRSIKPPPLTRTLGPVLQIDGKKRETRQRGLFTTVSELLDKLPEVDFIRFRLDPSHRDVLPFQAHGFQTAVQYTLQTDCRRPEEAIWADLRDRKRNAIRRAQECLSVVTVDDPAIFKDFYAANLENEKCYFSLDLIPRIHAAASAHGQGKILAAVDRRGDIHAQSFFIWDDQCCYYFLSTRHQAIAHAGAVSMLVWAGMQHARALGLTFDFDGVTSQPRYQFLVEFGGDVVPRFTVSKGSLLYEAQLNARRLADRLVGREVVSFY